MATQKTDKETQRKQYDESYKISQNGRQMDVVQYCVSEQAMVLDVLPEPSGFNTRNSAIKISSYCYTYWFAFS
jgi:hypothetical protein